MINTTTPSSIFYTFVKFSFIYGKNNKMMHSVKQKLLFKYRLLLPLFAVLLVLTACNESSDLGMELLPSTDLIEVKSLVERNSISSYTFTEGPIQTDEPSRSLLGSLYDPLFGVTTINFATQLRLLDRPQLGANPVADSVKLYLYYRLVYGDTVTPQTFRVYELQSPLDVDQTYRQDVDLTALASDFVLGEVIHTPAVRQDSASRDTFYQAITIPLDTSLGNKLLNAPDSVMANNDVFLNYFKGLLIESESQITQGGTILTLEAAYSNQWQGSALLVFYKNDEYRNQDTSLTTPYIISPYSARVNSITHDYSGTPFEANLNTETGEDSLIFVQATGGLKARIVIDNLSSWADSANTAINKAELVFQIDTVASDVNKFPPPSQLLLTFVNKDDKEALPADFSFSEAFYGGRLRTSDWTYRFNITQHMQLILDGEIENKGFYLTTARKNSEANRVVLKGSNSHTGIRLEITYSKFLQ